MAAEASPFHAGELHVQERVDSREMIASTARRVVRPYMPEQHRLFYQALPFLVAAARDGKDRPWATLLTGRPGFAHAPTDTDLLMDAALPTGDALTGALRTGTDLGLLGIDLASRRRNRLNGKVTRAGWPLGVRVTQAFGNCPQYIHPRDWQWVEDEARDTTTSSTPGLGPRARKWIETADTFFVASGYRGNNDHEAFGMDASHRGGPPGFVEVVSDTRLIFPDYAGNHFFNTIGNLVMDPGLGLLFVDFQTGSLLQVTGRASIVWDPGDRSKHPGAQRMITVDIDEVIELRGVLPLRWSASQDAVRTLRVIDRVRETTDVTSFLLASRDGGSLPGFRAGQHLPIELRIAGQRSPIVRTYSLSNGPGLACYRISVKRRSDGLVSRYLHESVQRGDIVNAYAPAGDFVLAPSRRTVALVSAGIGITPVMSMLHELAVKRTRRRVWFIHGTRNGDHHVFAREVRSLAKSNPNIAAHISYSRPARENVSSRDYDSEGRVDADLLERLLPSLEADFYLCGPSAFVHELNGQLEHRGVLAGRIHTEDFGNAP